jgi:hypothetical protein
VTIKSRLVKLESRNSKPLMTLEELIAKCKRLDAIIRHDDCPNCPNCPDCTTQELCRKAEMLRVKAGLF